jgi:hypothetical protein
MPHSHNLRIALQVVHGALELFAGLAGGLLAPVLVQRVHLLLGNLDIERRYRSRLAKRLLCQALRRFGKTEAHERRSQDIRRPRGALLQCGDVQAQCGKAIGHHLGRLVRAVERPVGELLNSRHHRGIERGGRFQLHDDQRALHLRELGG